MTWLRNILPGWQDVAIPLAVFAAFLLLTLWFRKRVHRGLDRWARRTGWQGYAALSGATRGPSLFLCLIIGLLLAVEVSALPPGMKSPLLRGLWSLFLLLIALASIGVGRGLVQIYLQRFVKSAGTLSASTNIATIAILVIFSLMILDIWGVPTSPLVLVIGIASIAILLAFRDALSSLFASFHLTAAGQIKPGDYIKLDSGEEGYIVELNWTNTLLEGLDGSTIIIPNSRMAQSKVVNYGRPLKQAAEPFRFYARMHLKELTGLKARTLKELVDILRQVPDSVIYYHTHHFIEEHHYLTPEPPNDIAVWVEDVLGDEVLGEKLASLDTFEFPTLGALRDRLVDIVEEHLTRNPDSREAPPGREFHFMKSVSAILPCPYVAHDLREFVEMLRNVSPGSLYFHIFESRLRLGRGANDFSNWIEENFQDPELAGQIAQLDPYNYTLEALRSSLIELIEKRIK